MKLFWIFGLLHSKCLVTADRYAPWIERQHNPTRYAPSRSRYIEGTDVRIPEYYESPDFREEEPPFLPYKPKFYGEDERPYRLSPHYKTTYNWHHYQRYDNIHYAGCYCTTVFKRLTPLAGCAVITTRHVLTTATSTHLVLKDRYDYPTLENILGVWYDTNHNTFNSSMYLTPSRIHYHPYWHAPEHVNRSHPFSFTFDLAVWASTHNVFGWYWNLNNTPLCLRAHAHVYEYRSAAPSYEKFIVVGFQYMWAFNRVPMPWYKYAYMTRKWVEPCPKTEWGWFVCLEGDWAKYGIEGGAALHRTFRGWSWMYDGLIAMGAFTMKLRSMQNVHYFTVLDAHVVLEFLYKAYEGRIPYVWLDERFYDTKYYAPRTKPGFWIRLNYDKGVEHKWGPPLA